MREYARTKTMAELCLYEVAPGMSIDIYRPGVVADLDRLLESGKWGTARRAASLYRRTQYVYAPDAAAAIAFLLHRGLQQDFRGVEAYNITDEYCGTFSELHARAYALTGDKRFRSLFHLPVVFDVVNLILRYRPCSVRYPLGMLTISNDKLRQTGFELPIGIAKAYEEAIHQTLNGSVP